MQSALLILFLASGTLALPSFEGGSFTDPLNSTDSDISSYITHGDPAYIPSFAVLKDINSQYSFCGGTLISRRHILTAAHCLMGRENFLVTLGVHDKNSGGYSYLARNVYVFHDGTPTNHEVKHECWTGHDIAIIELEATDVEMTDPINNLDVKAACLPIAGKAYTNKYATIAGYGRNELYFRSPVLLKGRVKLLDLKDCLRYIRSKTGLCSTPANSFGCYGDTGGPLFVREKNGKDILIGVMNEIRVRDNDDGFCSEGYLNGYTRVQSYLTWIKIIIGATENLTGRGNRPN